MTEQYPGNQFGTNDPMQPQQPWGAQPQQPQQQWGEQPTMASGQQVPQGWGQPEAPKKKRGPIIAAVAGAAALALVAGGVAVADPFGWRGGKHAVAEALPSSVQFAMMSDLDPSLSQKAEMVRFAMKFPALKEKLSLTEDGDIKKQMWEAITKDEPCAAVNYDADIKPWIGDKSAFAMVSDDDAIFALEASDEAAAREAMKKVATCGKKDDSKKTDGVAYLNGYLILAEDQAKADKAVADAKSSPLSARSEYVEDFKALGTTGIMSFWSGSEGFKAMQEEAKKNSPIAGGSAGKDVEISGFRSMAATLRFTGGNPEVKALVKSSKEIADSGKTTALGDLPADTKFALGIADGATGLDQAWPKIKEAIEKQGTTVEDFEAKANLNLPEDLKTLLGDDFRLALGSFDFSKLMSDPTSLQGGLALTTDKAKLDDLVSRLGLDALGLQISLGDKTHGIAMDSDWAGKLSKPSGAKLADEEAFKKAYPGGDKVRGGLYIDLTAIVKDLGEGMDQQAKDNIEPLQAFAASSAVEKDNYASVTARLTTK